MKNLISLLTAAVLATGAGQASAATFGYSNGECSRTASYVFRLGNTAKQGCAIKLSKDKLQALKGCKITSVSAGFGSSHITEGTLKIFITQDLNGNPSIEQEATIKRALSWQDYALEAPYTVTGDEEALYIGFYGEIDTSGTLLLGDKTASSIGTTYGYLNGEWTDLYGMEYGNPVIRFEAEGAPAITDVMLHPIDFDIYMLAGKTYDFTGYIYNYGTETVNSFDLNIKVGNAETQTVHIDGVEINQYKSHTFEIPALTSAAQGSTDISIEVTNVNGTADADASDNTYAAGAYFYPTDMERSILLEGFTGMDCSNCPTGHATVNTFLSSEFDCPVIEVMHHSGYQPDFLTTTYDLDYTYLYGSSSTYAPATMINRTVIPGIGTVPVMGVSLSNLNKAYAYATSKQPYVSMSIESVYDEATREIKVRVTSYTHNDLPQEQNVINVMLVQDNMTGAPLYQNAGGSSYVHHNVMRDVLTGNAWGLLLRPEHVQAGGQAVYETVYTLPETFANKYVSSPIEITTPVVVDDMYLVAYVSGVSGADISGYTVYNAVKAKLGENYAQSGGITGITTPTTDANDINISVIGGKIAVSGQWDAVYVYNVAGMAVDASDALPAGIYVVKAVCGNNTYTKKVVVR